MSALLQNLEFLRKSVPRTLQNQEIFVDERTENTLQNMEI